MPRKIPTASTSNLISVRLLVRFGLCNPGDIAAFDRPVAQQLLNAGHAQAPDAPYPVPGRRDLPPAPLMSSDDRMPATIPMPQAPDGDPLQTA